MNKDFVSKVFKWFGIGLVVTFLIAYVVSTNESTLSFVFSGYTPFIIMILEIVCAIWLSARINKMENSTATILYIGYTALTGLTFSSLFIMYELSSLIYVFLATSVVFFVFSFIGIKTKIDLNKFSIYLIVALLAVIILGLINVFLMSNTIDMVVCIATLVIFIGYVAYDMQKISRYSYSDDEKYAIIGAFNIYLDFINIFIELLRLFGDRRD